MGGGSGNKGTFGACFVEGTLILTEHGHVPIEQVQEGDLVWSENTITGQKGLKRVVNTYVNQKDSLINLHIDDILIAATLEHPFWVKNEGWTAAKKLNQQKLLKSRTGAILKVTASEQITFQAPVKVYNFEVEEWHCYYVSYLNLLVHNDSAMNPLVAGWGSGSHASPQDSVSHHFKIHGKEVGAKDEEQYLQKAYGFSLGAKKGSRKTKVHGDTDNVWRYSKNGKYIDIDETNKTIISFGSTKSTSGGRRPGNPDKACKGKKKGRK